MMSHFWPRKLRLISATLAGGKLPIYFACFVLGFLTCLFVRRNFSFWLKREVDPLGLLSILSTIVIALLITHYGRQNADNSRAFKNLIIELVKDAITQSRVIQDAFLLCCDDPATFSNNQKLQEFNVSFRKLSNVIHEIEETVQMLGDDVTVDLFKKECYGAFWHYKACITGIDWNEDKQQSGLANPDSRTKAESAFRGFTKLLYRSMVSINQS